MRWKTINFILLFLINSREVWPQDIRDIKSPLAYPSSHVLLWIMAALALLAMAGVIYYMKRMKKVTPKNLVIEPKAWEIAFKRLKNLKESDYLAKGEINTYYTELSEIVRHYMEDRFSIKAPEMTTEEFLNHLQNSNDLDSGQKIALKEFLVSCDMVKFAKFLPETSDSQKSFALAATLIEQTIPQQTSKNQRVELK